MSSESPPLARPSIAPQQPPASAISTSTNVTFQPDFRRRLSRRATEGLDLQSPPPPVRRRSSLVSDLSFDSARRSFRSSTDDLLLPRVDRHTAPDGTLHNDDFDPSHWHSAPLVFAIIPAVSGLFFQNGSAFVTDILLLVLAAIFLNWSVRLPWEWYHKAQTQKLPSGAGLTSPMVPEDTIFEESSDEGEEQNEDVKSPRTGNKAAIETSKTPATQSETQRKDDNVKSGSAAARGVTENLAASPSPWNNAPSSKREAAASELRSHELLALLCCFIGPAAGAFLLHTIRDQLSRPSEGLVSNYNLTIFLLAAELRPFAHSFKLMQARTLHLQRIVRAPDPAEERQAVNAHTQELERRLDELEVHLADRAAEANSPSTETKETTTAITQTVHQALQPQLDALTRASRRYEKRATTQAITTEARMQQLERRVQDALSLAAAAAQNSQRRAPGAMFLALFDMLLRAFLFPFTAMWTLVVSPIQVVQPVAQRAKVFLIGPRPRPRTTASTSSNVSGSSGKKRSSTSSKDRTGMYSTTPGLSTPRKATYEKKS